MPVEGTRGPAPADATRARGERNRRRSLVSPAWIATVLLAAALARPAAASPGNGIRLGGSDGRLHPFLELEGRYDSNVYYTAQQQQVADVIVHVRPGFDLSVPGELAAVELGGSADWAQYLGVDAPETKSRLSKLYGQASLGLSLNRRGVLGLELDDEFRRAQNTTALVLGNAVISNYNALGVRVPLRPGGGALVFTANGGWVLETFQNYFSDLQDVGALGYNEYRAGGEVKWRFLPRTAAVLQGGWFSRVPNAAAASKVSGFDTQAGVTGLVTPHLGATAKAGYSSTLGLTDGDLSSWIAVLELEWIATDNAGVRLGWTHALGIDPGPSLYTSHRVYAGGRILLAGRYALRLDGNFESRDYRRTVTAGATSGSATADVFRVEPALEAVVARWMTVSVGYAYGKRTSSFPGAAALPGYEFTKSETWLRLLFRY